ncbi:hypothetical protein, conserved [Plasmodium gonderi]|uniref:RAP domain-containing protein n=1 Tax=Plasmodium gonderi TaxID=77519 RepID=A0A1Y1JLI7_PLAGO|nr:hypothetical protein, conserved [Plasmodium gonderi]GAW80914.1 hypothetical protein, conserved [Plasmodium gonderi]
MLIPYTSKMIKSWVKHNGKKLFCDICWVIDKRQCYYYIFKKNLSSISMNKVMNGNLKQQCGKNNTLNDEIANHVKNQYDIDPNSIDLNIQRNKENNLFELTNRWNTFFKCEKSLYKVINKYLKTNNMDYSLHDYLKCTPNEGVQNLKVLSHSWENVKNLRKEQCNKEEEIINILIYIMTLFHKQIRDFSIFSMLSERLICLLNMGNSKNYSEQTTDSDVINKYKFKFNCSKDTILKAFHVYNSVKVMNDELFDILFDKLNNCYTMCPTQDHQHVLINDEEILLTLITLYNQNFKNHAIIDTIIMSLKKSSQVSPAVLVNSILYLTLLSRVDIPLLDQMNSSLFYVSGGGQQDMDYHGEEKEQMNRTKKVYNTTNTDDNNICESEIDKIKFKFELSATDCIKLLYAYFVLGEDYINWFVIHKLLLQLCDNLKDEQNILLLKKEKEKGKIHEMVCIIRSFLRYKKRNVYDNLPKSVKKVLKNLCNLYTDNEKKKIRDRNFVHKLSWHLIKLRIPHVININKGGILFDVLEKNKKLVWLCFSYHHYYVKTIDLTAEKLLQMEIIKAMNYKIAKIHYYQFSRMKARRTRFEYIRMCRYYSLRDRRNYDTEFEGWSLPYINWYHKKNKNVHVSNYFYNYNPLSEMQY